MRVALLTTDSIIGTDALVPLDGRWGRESIDDAVRAHVESLRHVQSNQTFYGYTLHRSSLHTVSGTVTFTPPLHFDS